MSVYHRFDRFVIRHTNCSELNILVAMMVIECVRVCVVCTMWSKYPIVLLLFVSRMHGSSCRLPPVFIITFYGFYFYTCDTRCHLFQRWTYCVSCFVVIAVVVASNAFRFRSIRLCQEAMRVVCVHGVHGGGANFSWPHMERMYDGRASSKPNNQFWFFPFRGLLMIYILQQFPVH